MMFMISSTYTYALLFAKNAQADLSEGEIDVVAQVPKYTQTHTHTTHHTHSHTHTHTHTHTQTHTRVLHFQTYYGSVMAIRVVAVLIVAVYRRTTTSLAICNGILAIAALILLVIRDSSYHGMVLCMMFLGIGERIKPRDRHKNM